MLRPIFQRYNLKAIHNPAKQVFKCFGVATNISKIQSEPSVLCEFGGVGGAYFALPMEPKQFTLQASYSAKSYGAGRYFPIYSAGVNPARASNPKRVVMVMAPNNCSYCDLGLTFPSFLSGQALSWLGLMM
ncbi:MAG: hypothetical protein H6536_01820 [Bacteroidales bacterium]|nr:hypothetical protein [Bacteroidales bacterium]